MSYPSFSFFFNRISETLFFDSKFREGRDYLQSENPNEAPDFGTTYAWKDLQIAAFS